MPLPEGDQSIGSWPRCSRQAPRRDADGPHGARGAARCRSLRIRCVSPSSPLADRDRPATCISRLAQPNSAAERMRSRISASSRPAARSAAISVGAGRRRGLRQRGGKVEDRAGRAATSSRRVAVGEEPRRSTSVVPDELGVPAGMDGGAVDAAVDHGGADRAQLALRPAQAAVIVHDRVEQRRADLQRLDVVGEGQHIVRDLGVRRRHLERVELRLASPPPGRPASTRGRQSGTVRVNLSTTRLMPRLPSAAAAPRRRGSDRRGRR